ncbi:phosphatidylglycerol lysyltransferase domain-containing protein [uncultured Treponema sp.]|uniref:DUF2156 domain-containing protein n=1 Tax=uncultured Treponema sp. TaxID=162155 RepID=UPI0025D18507|nr:phosphatidylglycerol lysyltransferase domain-containing protein [uncultured Treponema sp.]
MNLSDFEWLGQNLRTEKLLGSDSAPASIFLLQDKYGIELLVRDGFLFRRYNGNGGRNGFGFPLAVSENSALKDALSFLVEKCSAEKTPLRFCLCTRDQKNEIDSCLAENFPRIKISWNSDRADSDYIYLAKNLADLPGQKFHKKKNHIARFMRLYGNRWEFRTFPENDIADDIIYIEEKWLDEKNSSGGNPDHALLLEKKSITSAVEFHSALNIRGGVLYVDKKPAAMTLASPVSSQVLDIHFEKALSDYAADGAYSVVNNLFAKESKNFLYLNREEDMGVEGLRKAKLSYKPDIILDKFYGEAEM